MHSIINTILRSSLRVFFKLINLDKIISQPNIQKITNLYQGENFGGLSVKIRFWDSPLSYVETKVPPQGTILDLGCGEGVLTNFLAISKPTRKVVGMEISDRVDLADRKIKNTKFIKADVLKANFPKCDTIVMNHLLHHLPSFESQKKLITKCYNELQPGGNLIIVEVDRRFSLKYLLVWLTDIIIVPILFEGKLINLNIFQRPGKEWEKILTQVGFKIHQQKRFKDGPFPDILFICQKD